MVAQQFIMEIQKSAAFTYLWLVQQPRREGRGYSIKFYWRNLSIGHYKGDLHSFSAFVGHWRQK